MYNSVEIDISSIVGVWLEYKECEFLDFHEGYE